MGTSEPAGAGAGASDAWAAAARGRIGRRRRAAAAAGPGRLRPRQPRDRARVGSAGASARAGAGDAARGLRPDRGRARRRRRAGRVRPRASPGSPDGPHLHSHMLATVPEWQSRGVGFALKLAQRAAALDAGFDDVRWTYDPLLARNAWFNLTKLGRDGDGVPARVLRRDDRPAERRRPQRPVRGAVVPSIDARSRGGRGRHGRRPSPDAAPPLLEAAGDPDAPEPVATSARPEPGATVAIPAGLPAAAPRRPRAWALGGATRPRRPSARCFDAGLQAVAMSKAGVYTFDMVKEPDDHE